MTPLHRLRPEHYQKQALAAHYLSRAVEFKHNAEDSDAEHWVNMWTIAKHRQMEGARKVLEQCCGPRYWTKRVKDLYPQAEPLVPGPAL